MLRTVRVIVPNCPHHIVRRGGNRNVAFVSDEDCAYSSLGCIHDSSPEPSDLLLQSMGDKKSSSWSRIWSFWW